ncbi:peptidylprolyl isomerase [Listeria sp. PSOL-1]|uniref:peptidylprolyl isomerase n=1 Tax=Listeria sp. PSOL-1 TaxID=1844999 RepID=UPI0013D7D566|nr:peptidylprolyl isomerase [Listeria sp. PSOL-1]
MTYPQLSKEVAQNEITAEMKTNRGTIQLKLFPDIAPKAVENFVTHAKNGYYNGLIFHRVIPEFMIQGGDPAGLGTGGESIWGTPFEDEFSREAFNLRGALSMANAGPNTNGSQFFIVQKPDMPEEMLDQMKEVGFPEEVIEAYKNGGTPWLDGRHTVFGHVINGMDVVDDIAKVQTGAQDKPVYDVIIESIDIKE